MEQWCIQRRKQSYFNDNQTLSMKSDKQETELIENPDELISKAWSEGKLKCLTKLLNLIQTNKIHGHFFIFGLVNFILKNKLYII